MRSNQAERGSLLIVVLWSLFFLAALALVINISITPQLGLAAKLRDRTATRYLAQAGLRRAIIEIRLDETEEFDALNDLWSRNEEAFKEIALSDNEYFSVEYVLPESEEGGEEEKQYGLIDEERKININAMPAEVLKQFFEIVAETSSQDATDIADAIIDWRDEDDEPLDNGAENAYYESLEDGYPCKNGRFEILEELFLVKGITPDIYEKVKSRLTVFGSGQVNINTADELVLQGLGMGEELAKKVVLFRKGGDGESGSEDDNFFEDGESITATLSGGRTLSPEEQEEFEVAAAFLGVRSDNFRGEVVGGFKDREGVARITFVIHRDEKIRYWRES